MLDNLHKLFITRSEWTGTHIFDQGGEDAVCASQFPQQCNGTGSRQQGRLDELIQCRQKRPELQRHRFLYRILLACSLGGLTYTSGA